MLNSVETIQSINHLVKKETPFLFIISFDRDNNVVLSLDQLKQNKIFFKTPGLTNIEITDNKPVLTRFEKDVLPFEKYQSIFNRVIHEINRGNSFLLNLTVPTRVSSNLSLFELFQIAEARYKLYYDNTFTLFSPEPFISIENGIIKTYPMKGTIRADVPDAVNLILSDSKEAAEHATIVDLLRNDLSIVASNVTVSKFRYAELVQTNYGAIYQVSSEIQGELPENYKRRLGDIVMSLLPAGSVTGAPKEKTVNIIKDVELTPRGFYTGIFGVWDTKKLDTAVMIRFIRNIEGNLWYHSGGGITFQSNCESEYNEIIDKIYVPIR